MTPTLTLKSGTAWADAWQRCQAVAPEAFRDDRVLNLWNATWQADGRSLPAVSPVDGGPVAGPAPPGPGHRPAGRARGPGPAPRLAARPAAGTPGPRRRHPGRARRAPRPARPAARLGDRQALATGPRRRRPGHRRRPLVRRRHRRHARRPHPARRPRLQHRELELPDERAGPRPAGAGAGRQRGRRQDPDRRRRRLPHPGHGARRPRGHPGHPRQRQRGRAVRGTGAGAGDRLRLLRRRTRHRCGGRHGSRRPGQTPHPRTGGTEHLGHLELLRLGHPGRGDPQAVRLRQAALHGLPALRRPAQPLRRVPRRLPPGRPHPADRPPPPSSTPATRTRRSTSVR